MAAFDYGFPVLDLSNHTYLYNPTRVCKLMGSRSLCVIPSALQVLSIFQMIKNAAIAGIVKAIVLFYRGSRPVSQSKA